MPHCKRSPTGASSAVQLGSLRKKCSRIVRDVRRQQRRSLVLVCGYPLASDTFARVLCMAHVPCSSLVWVTVCSVLYYVLVGSRCCLIISIFHHLFVHACRLRLSVPAKRTAQRLYHTHMARMHAIEESRSNIKLAVVKALLPSQLGTESPPVLYG